MRVPAAGISGVPPAGRAPTVDEALFSLQTEFTMATFIMLTKLASGVSRTAPNLAQLQRSAVELVKQQCPNVRWLNSYAVLGRPDYVDVFTAPDVETAMKVSALVRTFGAADTEIWPALEWEQFKTIARSMQT